MDDKYKRQLSEGKKEFDEFRNEPPFTVSSFMEELVFLLGDYFLGNFELRGDDIFCTFANGQVIKLNGKNVIAGE